MPLQGVSPGSASPQQPHTGSPSLPQKPFLQPHWKQDQAVSFMIQRGGFCLFPMKRNKVEIGFLNRLDGSEPGRCICGHGEEACRWHHWPVSSLRGTHGIGHLCRSNLSTHGRRGAGQAGPWRESAVALPYQMFIFLPSPCFWTTSENRVDLRWGQRTASRKGGLEKPASRKAAFSPVKMALTYIWFPQ